MRTGWQRIPWDGNTESGQFVWRKNFGPKGHVSVGCGEFLSVVFSYGANSDKSYTSTRWDYGRPVISEQDAMDAVDRGAGEYMLFRRTVAERDRREAEDKAFMRKLRQTAREEVSS